MKAHEKIKRIGVWMDHAEAKLAEPEHPVEAIQEVEAESSGRVREPGETGDGVRVGVFRSANNEFRKHIKRQHDDQLFYKELSEELLPYDEILIFGPTTAEKEFYNYLMNEKHFAGKRISSRQENYMSDNQIVAFVNEHMK
jgi:hypothetical protein